MTDNFTYDSVSAQVLRRVTARIRQTDPNAIVWPTDDEQEDESETSETDRMEREDT